MSTTTQKLLEKNNYHKQILNKGNGLYPYASCFYQKKFNDEKGVKYFVQFVYYAPIPIYQDSESWMLDFVNNNPFYTFKKHRIKLKTEQDLINLESECELFWMTFKCAYYESYP